MRRWYKRHPRSILVHNNNESMRHLLWKINHSSLKYFPVVDWSDTHETYYAAQNIFRKENLSAPKFVIGATPPLLTGSAPEHKRRSAMWSTRRGAARRHLTSFALWCGSDVHKHDFSPILRQLLQPLNCFSLSFLAPIVIHQKCSPLCDPLSLPKVIFSLVLRLLCRNLFLERTSLRTSLRTCLRLRRYFLWILIHPNTHVTQNRLNVHDGSKSTYLFSRFTGSCVIQNASHMTRNIRRVTQDVA